MKLTGLEQSIFDNFLVEHLEVQPSVSLHKKKQYSILFMN